ncbi:MAG TPA: hypothetical protein VIL65_13790 [Beijerinckiaceae bacterium]|jgi:hypothetical protein
MWHIYFHCTNGSDLILDESGQDIEDDSDRTLYAASRVIAVQKRHPEIIDWSDWMVAMHDQYGSQIDTTTFEEIESAILMAQRLARVAARRRTSLQGSRAAA